VDDAVVDYSELLLISMIQAFRAHFKAIVECNGMDFGSKKFVIQGPLKKALIALSETKMLNAHKTADGHLAIIKFRGREYKVEITPIKSAVKIEKPLTFNDVFRVWEN
jgi:hypothetical protein